METTIIKAMEAALRKVRVASLDSMFVLLIGLLFLSCQNDNKISMADLDEVIEQYGKTDFSNLRGSFVIIRQKDFSEIIYLVHGSEGNQPVYIVRYDTNKEKIMEIDSSMFEKMDAKPYYSVQKITGLIEEFRKYDLALLGVDEDNNVYINPTQIGSPPSMLRADNYDGAEILKKGYVYTHYKDNWYKN